ncbi:protein ASPARTIC PROTEASE IN GUARD CELL 1-like [Capsicum galapagoense]
MCLYEVDQEQRVRMAEEVITFVLDQNQERIHFGCGKDQTSGKPVFGGYYSGIECLGRRVLSGGYSLPSQFEAYIMAMFFINDKEIPLNPSIWNLGNGIHSGCIVDTGTVITRFPRDFYTVFRDTFKQVVEIPLFGSPVGPLDTCFIEDPGFVPNFPIVKMYFGHRDPNNLLLLKQLRVVVHIRGLFCLMPWDSGVALIGSTQLQGIGLTFDTAANTLSFELDACN